MVELKASTDDSVREGWLYTTREALHAGLAEEDLYSMLKTEASVTQEQHRPTCPPDTQDPRHRLHGCATWSHLCARGSKEIQRQPPNHSDLVASTPPHQKGRLRGSARGGGFVLVSEDELVDYINTPKRIGRPPKQKPIP